MCVEGAKTPSLVQVLSQSHDLSVSRKSVSCGETTLGRVYVVISDSLCVYACVRACVRACVCVCVCACVRACVLACVR